jgi:preprotein translocase subunit SecD
MIAIRLASVILLGAVICGCQSPQQSASPTSSTNTTAPTTTAPTTTQSAGPAAKIQPSPIRPVRNEQPTMPEKCPATNPNAPVAATDVLTTCSLDRTFLYTLGPEALQLGLTQVDSPKSSRSGGYEVGLTLDASSATAWNAYMAAHLGTQVAFIRDDLVLDAPEIVETSTSGRILLTTRTAQEAGQVAQLVSRPA